MTSRSGLSRYTYPAHVPWEVLSRTRGGTLTVRFLPSSCTKGGLVATASKLAAATSQTAELFALLYPRNGGMCEFLRRAQVCLAGTPPDCLLALIQRTFWGLVVQGGMSGFAPNPHISSHTSSRPNLTSHLILYFREGS